MDDATAPKPGTANAGIGFRPLYQQVRDALIQRLANGHWQPGEVLPSEPALAAELGVSHGTVRKALDAMTQEKLLVRKQGRGTFVAQHDDQRVLFQYFKLVPDEGDRAFPESRILGIGTGPAGERERDRLQLRAGAICVRIRRKRMLAGLDTILEDVILPEALFPGIAEVELPNNLYGLYATRFGVTIARATERVKAVALGDEDARMLAAPVGTPVLEIDRVALSIDGRPVEWRVSLCRTAHVHYLSDLR